MQTDYAKSNIDKIMTKDKIDILNKMIDQNEESLNGIVFLNEPFKEGTLAALFFSQMYSIESTNNGPKINEEAFKQLPEDKQVIELKAIMDMFVGYLKTMDDLERGFKHLIKIMAERLRDINPKAFDEYFNDEEKC